MAATTYQGDPTAVMGRRVLAYLIDSILMLLLIGVLVVPYARDLADKQSFPTDAQASAACDVFNDDANGTTEFRSGSNFCLNLGEDVYLISGDDATDLQSRLTLISVGAALANLVVLQGLVGASIGKLVTGLRVVRQDGKTANIGWALLRWVLLYLDALCCILPGLVVAISSKGHRRIGDMAAGTFVVKRSAVGQPLYISGLTAAPPSSYGTTGGYGGAYQPQAGGWAPPAQPGAPTSWDQPAASGGWTPPASDPTTVAPGATPGADGPTWDAARNAYIQWDPAQSSWVQWDDASSTWKPIS